MLSTFLVDTAVRTRALPWTTGNALPVRWETNIPLPIPLRGRQPNSPTRSRTGSFLGTLGDSVTLPMTLTLFGVDEGLSRVAVDIPSMDVTLQKGGGFMLTREMVEQALQHEGLTLQPLKCSRAREGASYGNLVDALKAPGKTASGLWWSWNSERQAMSLSLTIVYRRADLAQVECQG